MDSTMAEALAVWETVKFCVNQEWQQMIIEGDALMALNNPGQCWSDYGHLIEDTKVLLERVEPLDISHVNPYTGYIGCESVFRLHLDR